MAKKRATRVKRKLVKKPKIELPTKKTLMSDIVTQYVMVFYGPPGVGKTTFVNGLADNVLFLSTDRGTRFIDALRVEIHSWEEFDAALKQIERVGKDRYDFVCIDHIDDICTMAEQAVCKKLGIDDLTDAGFGKGWKAYKDMLRDMTQRILRCQLGVVYIAHEKKVKEKTRSIEITKTVPGMSASASNVILPMAHLIGYCGFKRIKKGGKVEEVRVLETTPTEVLYAKDRTNRNVPPEIELLDGAAFIETFKTRKPGNNAISKKKVNSKARRKKV